MTTPIESLPNLGPKSSQWLRDAGINTVADLWQLGPVAAFQLVKERQPKASLNLLWALESSLKGNDWRQLPAATKERLRRKVEKGESK